MSESRIGSLAAAGAAALFGSSFVATAFALRSFGPLAIGSWRGIGAALIVGLVLGAGHGGGAIGRDSFDRRRLARLAVLGVLGGPLFVISMNVAVGATGATIASFVAGLYAVLAAVAAPIVLRERLGPAALIGFVIALAGTALLAELDPGSSSVGGIGAGFVAAGSFAAYLLLSRRWARVLALPGMVIAEATYLATVVVLLPILLLSGAEPLVPPTIEPAAIVALVWLILGPGVGGQSLVVASVRRIPARRSSAFLLLNPITAAVLAALLLGERLTPIQLVGAVLVLLGIVLASGIVDLVLGRDSDSLDGSDAANALVADGANDPI